MNLWDLHKGVKCTRGCLKSNFPHLMDMQGWIYSYEQFFEVDDTPAGSRVKITVIHLEGKTLMWHQTHIRQSLLVNGLVGGITSMQSWGGLVSKLLMIYWLS